MNANRMFRQFKYADHLQSICLKIEAHVRSGTGHA